MTDSPAPPPLADSERALDTFAELRARAEGRVGAVLAEKYSLKRVLGVGGMAAVYEAEHRTGARFAVKVLHERVDLDATRRERFRREAYLANRIKHPAIVIVLDDDVTADGLMFFVMPLLEGETLRDRWQRARKRLTVDEVVAIGLQLLNALAAAHAAKVIHRDIKPENLFLTNEGKLLVLDFGIARLLEQGDAASMTRSGRAVGTPAFMAPEQALGRIREVDHRTDLWAVGATLFTLVSGRFVHEAETAGELTVFAATRPAPAVQTVAPHVPAAIAKVIDKALRFTASTRWESATAMGAALAQACETSLGRSEGSLAKVLARSGAGDRDAVREPSSQASHDGMTATMGTAEIHARRNAPTHTSEVSLPPTPLTDSVRPARTVRVRTSWRPLRIAAATLVVGLAGVVGVVGISRKRAHDAATAVQPLAPGPHVLAVLGPRNASGEHKDGWLSTAFAEFVTSAMSVNGVQTVSGDTIANLTRDLRVVDSMGLTGDALKRAGEYAGSDLVAGGEYTVTAGVLHLSLAVHEAATGKLVGKGEAEGPESDFVGVVQKASAALRQSMALAPLTTVEMSQVRASLPANVEATKAYTGGLELQRAYDLQGARERYLTALGSDANHALTHWAVARVSNLLGDGGPAEAEASRALDLSRDLFIEQRLLSEGLYYLQLNRVSAALDRLKSLSEIAPTNTEYLYILIDAQNLAHLHSDASSTLARIRKFSMNAGANPRLDKYEAGIAMWQNDDQPSLKAARRAIEGAQARGMLPIVADGRMFEAVALWDLGMQSEALQSLEKCTFLYRTLGDRYKENYAAIMSSNFQYDMMDLRRARVGYESELTVSLKIGAKRQFSEIQGMLAELETRTGDLEAAAKRIRDAEGRDPTVSGIEYFNSAKVAIALRSGRWREAATLTAEFLASKNTEQDDASRCLLFAQSSRALLELGDLRGATIAARSSFDTALTGVRELIAAGRGAMSRVALARGDAEASLRALDATFSEGRQRPTFALEARTLLAKTKHLLGKRDEAVALLDQSPRPEDCEDIHVRLEAIEVRAAVDVGHLPTSEIASHLEAALRDAREHGLVVAANSLAAALKKLGRRVPPAPPPAPRASASPPTAPPISPPPAAPSFFPTPESHTTVTGKAPNIGP